MKQHVLAVPESYIFYLQKPNNKAIELINSLKTPPESLNWHELGQFYEAKFAYQRIRHDYYFFLRELWEKTWGIYFNLDEAAYGDIENHTVKCCWNNGSLHLNFQNKKFALTFGVYFFYSGLYGVFFFLKKADNETSLMRDIQSISSAWYINEKDGCWETASSIAISDMKDGIDLTTLQNTVHEAKVVLEPYLDKVWLRSNRFQ